MGRTAVIVALCAAALAGCRTAGNRTADRGVPAEAQTGITEEFGRFIDFAMNEDYDGIKSLVSARQSQGFDAKLFVEDRFRLRAGSFQIVVWDKKRIGVTPVKGEKYYLAAAVAHVRILSTNEVAPIYVNLYWTQEGGGWRILPFPQSSR